MSKRFRCLKCGHRYDDEEGVQPAAGAGCCSSCGSDYVHWENFETWRPRAACRWAVFVWVANPAGKNNGLWLTIGGTDSDQETEALCRHLTPARARTRDRRQEMTALRVGFCWLRYLDG